MSTKIKKVRVGMDVGQAAKQVGDVAQQGLKAVTDVTDQAGKVQEGIDSAISSIVNPIASMGNDAIKGLTGQTLFETDPTGVAEFITESLGTVQKVVLVTQMTLKQLVGLNNDVQKNLIKVSDSGDKFCDSLGGKLKMSIQLPNLQPPHGWTRWFDACIEAETAKKVIESMAKNPMEPIAKFAECAISEDLIKPIDNVIVDIKDAIANVVSSVGNVGDIQKVAMNTIQMVTDGLENFLAGSYTINPLNLDTISCFQNKMSGLEYKTTGFDTIVKNLTDIGFITGQKIRKPEPMQPKLPVPVPAPVPAGAQPAAAKSIKNKAKYRKTAERLFCEF